VGLVTHSSKRTSLARLGDKEASERRFCEDRIRPPLRFARGAKARVGVTEVVYVIKSARLG
jgi:hypothetical protein